MANIEYRITFIFIIILGLILSISCSQTMPIVEGQSNRGINATALQANQPSGYRAQVKVTSSSFHFHRNETRESFVNQPAPNLELMFTVDYKKPGSDEEFHKTDLPDLAKGIIDVYWKELLAYKFDNEINRPLNGAEYKRRMSILLVASDKAILELQKVSLEGPNGLRAISFEEASEIVELLGSVASELTSETGNNQ